MTRLRQTDREAILHVLVERGMKKSRAALAALKIHTAMVGYTALYGPTTQAQMDKLPDGWLPTAKTVNVIHSKQPDSKLLVDLPKTMRFRAADTEIWGSPSLIVPKDVYDKLDAAFDANRDKEEALKRKISGVLASVSTWKQLYEVWPAASAVLVKLEPSSADNLPAIIPQELNEELELP